jgi:hypothetical protein
MLAENNIAFKEWAVVCQALATGCQTIILRKGGIHERADEFRVDHREFWLYPTRFHETSASLTPDAVPLLQQVLRDQPPPGQFRLRQYATIDNAFELSDERDLQSLRGHHILADEIVHERFHYKQPGLHALVVRVFKLPQAHILSETPEIAGCKSWVELPRPLSTHGVTPVLADDLFDRRRADLLAALEKPKH